MGLFDRLFKSRDTGLISISSHARGKVQPLDDVDNERIRNGELGRGIAIWPEEGKICSPVDGTVELMYETGTAVHLRSADGIEIFIEVGTGTIELGGDGFKARKKTEETVKKGDVLIEFDRDMLLSRGYDILTPMVILNSNEMNEVRCITGRNVTPSDTVIEVMK